MNPDPPLRPRGFPNALPALLPMAQDTRFAPAPPVPQQQAAPQQQLPAPRQESISATNPGWFERMVSAGRVWARNNDVPNVMEYPPIQLLSMVLGANPIESVGPGSAISAFARRNPEVMRRFADPGFHNWIIKQGPRQPFSGIRDWAPETVIEDLWRQYSATPSAQFGARRGEARRAVEVGRATGRRAADAPTSAATRP